MYQPVDFFIEDKGASWLTVGDGRYGLDAIRLKRKGVISVSPSDISESLLRKSKEDNLIDHYFVENAESLSFEDNSFDFVFCKESYHHFPRPMIALYEMIRVARKAVILLEPNDNRFSPLNRLLYHIRKTLGKVRHFDQNNFEELGNYVYSISEREIEKVALGLNLPAVAFKGINDYYVKGCEYEPISLRSKGYRKIRIMVLIMDVLSRLRLTKPNLLMAIIFNNSVNEETCKKLRDNGWNVNILPGNPHADPLPDIPPDDPAKKET
jgi:SAM-dependent methyltransferase